MKNEELDHRIEKAFRAEPDFHLSTDFAQKVAITLVRHEQWKTDLLEYLSIAGVLLLLLAVVSGFYYFIDKEIVMHVFSFLSENVIQVFLVVFLLNFILFADRVLLRLLFRSLPQALPRRGVSTS